MTYVSQTTFQRSISLPKAGVGGLVARNTPVLDTVRRVVKACNGVLLGSLVPRDWLLWVVMAELEYSEALRNALLSL